MTKLLDYLAIGFASIVGLGLLGVLSAMIYGNFRIFLNVAVFTIFVLVTIWTLDRIDNIRSRRRLK